MAMPAAPVTACCSAMPTSKKRSGKRAWNGSSPVGPAIAAVIATTRESASASLMIASANACVYPVGTALGGPVRGSNTGASWRCFSSSSSAGG